jgi:uncharacterized OB-fold protein
MKEIALSQRGKVYSSTVHRHSKRPTMYEGPVPYAYGYVELPEGLIIRTVFTDCGYDKPLSPDTPVELVLEKFEEDEEGNEVIVYRFRPIPSL